MSRVAADVQLVDDGVLERPLERLVAISQTLPESRFP